MKELWKDIPGYSGKYEVSNLGKIRNYKTKNILKEFCNKSTMGYNTVKLSNPRKTFKIHRLVAICFIEKKDLQSIYVDHIDNDRCNNDVRNLRWVTPRQNRYNSKGFGSSKYLGVSVHSQKRKYTSQKTGKVTYHTSKPKFKASINNNGKCIHLGLFECEENAAKAYDEAAKKYHKEFANLNFKY